MKFARVFACALLVASAPWVARAAEPVTLKFATLNPPMANVSRELVDPWVARVNAAAPAALHVQSFPLYALANNLNVLDRVMSDVAQIAWAIPVYFTGKFVTTDVNALPFVADKSEYASTAYWRLYEKGVFGKEYADLHPLILMSLPQSGIHLASKEVKTLADMKGLKFRAGSKVSAEVVAALGATPITLNVGEMFSALQRHVVDGVLMPWTAFSPFKLDEVTHYHIDVPFGGAPAMIFMTKKKYELLSDAAKKALDANSGEQVSRDAGKWWDKAQAATRALIEKKPGHKVVSLPPAEYAKWKGEVEKVLDRWGSTTPGGAKVLTAFRAEIANVAAGR